MRSPREFYVDCCVTILIKIFSKTIGFIPVKTLVFVLKNGKIIHKKNAFLLFLFLCMKCRNLIYICLRRDVAALKNEEKDYEKDFDLYAGSCFMSDYRHSG